MLGIVEKVLLASLLLVLMAGMGATLTPKAFRDLLRAPRGVLIGIASQFGWMPLIAFALATAFSLPPELAIGLILVGCTPGGTTSNLFTYYARADLALSISMTVASTVVAVALMPLLLYTYAQPFTDATLSIPYGSIVSTLVIVLVPVAVGMRVRARSADAAARLERFGSIAGVLVLLLLIGTSLWRNRADLAQVPGDGYLAAIALGLLGMGLGYLAARVMGLSVPARRAVSLETGIQNSPLAMGIILASFPEHLQTRVLWLPMAYALFVLINATWVTWLFRLRPDGMAEPAQAAGVGEAST